MPGKLPAASRCLVRNHVRVNLARCAMWFMSLGTFDKNAHRTPSPLKPPTEN
jgi:hypothetical protein